MAIYGGLVSFVFSILSAFMSDKTDYAAITAILPTMAAWPATNGGNAIKAQIRKISGIVADRMKSASIISNTQALNDEADLLVKLERTNDAVKWERRAIWLLTIASWIAAVALLVFGKNASLPCMAAIGLALGANSSVIICNQEVADMVNETAESMSK